MNVTQKKALIAFLVREVPNIDWGSDEIEALGLEASTNPMKDIQNALLGILLDLQEKTA